MNTEAFMDPLGTVVMVAFGKQHLYTTNLFNSLLVTMNIVGTIYPY